LNSSPSKAKEIGFGSHFNKNQSTRALIQTPKKKAVSIVNKARDGTDYQMNGRVKLPKASLKNSASVDF
jgi:hypothetical protein